MDLKVTRTDRLVSAGQVVQDYDVSHLYPGAVRRAVKALPLSRGGGPTEIMINVFEASTVAVTTPCYLPIDLKTNRLFANQTYSQVLSHWKGEPRITGDSYHYDVCAPRVVPGKTLLLGGPFVANYYHWMLNWFSRLSIVKMLRPDVFHDEMVNILVDEGARRAPYIDLLLASGVDPKRFIWARGGDLILEDAVLVSFANRDETCPEIVGATREILGSIGIASGARRRLWISRQALGPGRRRVSNMDEVSTVLAAHDFDNVVLEEMPVAEQIGLFRSAEAIVGVHGAGLTNMIFSPQDCRVVSIESDLNVKLGLNKFYSTLAEACGLDHTHLRVKRDVSLGRNEHNFANAHKQDYRVPPRALDALLSEFLPRPGMQATAV